jgi:uncharacterized protein (DUF58 family)
MALTRKAVLYLALAYAFIGLSLVFSEPALASFVVPLSFAIFYSSLVARHEKPQLKVKRTLSPPRSFGGEDIQVTLELRNSSTTAVHGLHLEDTVPESLQLETGTNTLNVSLEPGERFEHSYIITSPKRGRYLLGPIKVDSTDLMGFRQYSEIIPGLDQIVILPKVVDLGTVELRARRVGPWPGTVPSRYLGVGTEFFELRLYSPGDELRRINWKASAKRGQLVTNEFETERVTDVLVVVDCSEETSSHLFTFDAEELEVGLAASMSSQLLLQGNRVGLLVYGAERTWVAPSFGKRQLLRILTGLALVKAGHALVPLGYAVETIAAAVLPARSVVVFVSPLISEEAVEVVRNIAGAGYSVTCLTPAVEPVQAESESRTLARRILATERRINIRRTAAFSRVVELSPRSNAKVLLRRRLPWRLA